MDRVLGEVLSIGRIIVDQESDETTFRLWNVKPKLDTKRKYFETSAGGVG